MLTSCSCLFGLSIILILLSRIVAPALSLQLMAALTMSGKERCGWFCIAARGAKGDIALCQPCLGTTLPFCSIVDAQLIYGGRSLTALFRFRRGRSHRVLPKLSQYNLSGLSHRGKSFTHRRKSFPNGGKSFPNGGSVENGASIFRKSFCDV